MSTDYFVTTTTANAAIEKHIKFWDRKNKGFITPVDAVFGFIHLGYGIVASVTIGTFLGVLLSYSTQDSWMPDPLCRTRTEKLQKNIQNEPYDMDGKLDLELFDNLFSKHARADISGKTITLKELLEWNESTYKDPLSWTTTTLEWLAIYLMVGNNGVVKREDIQAAYDGTLFYQVRDRNKQHKSIKSTYNTSSSSSSSSLSISGVMVPKSYVRQLETQLNNAVNILPRSTVLTLETRLRHWLSFVQQQQQRLLQQTPQQRQPILKGVVTPAPRRRSLFSNAGQSNGYDSDYDDASDVSFSSSSLFQGGLTGVMAINLLDRPMALTGVQGYEKHYSDGEDEDDNVDVDGYSHRTYINNGRLAGLKAYSIMDDDENGQGKHEDEGNNDGLYGRPSYGIAGLRPDGEDYYRDTPQVDWLGSEHLTGVSPSSSAYLNTRTEEDNGELDGDITFGSISLTGLQQQSSATPSLTDSGSSDTMDDNNINKDKTPMHPIERTPPALPAKENEFASGQQQQGIPKRQDSIDATTPPFTGSPSSHEADDDDDLPDSPNSADTDAKNNTGEGKTDNSTKDRMSRPPWPTLTEVVPSEN